MVDIAKCGGWITAPNGTLTSPDYPRGTESGTECLWIIQVPRNHYVELMFTDVHLDNRVNGQCSTSSVIEIRDYNETGRTMSRLNAGVFSVA